jgi:CBS domain containing-hemolysin-like protein
LGPIESAAGIELVESIGPFKYRMAGDILIHDWADAFGINPEEAKVSTIGGLVASLLGRIPRKGDVAYLQNFKFTVEEVHKHRLKSVILEFEGIDTNGP